MSLYNAFEDFSPGPLDSYRKQATFNWKEMKLYFDEEELLNIRMLVWKTLDKDPIFKRPTTQLSTEEMKQWASTQLYRYSQYNFLPKTSAGLSYRKLLRFRMSINEALAATFPDVSVKYAVGVSLFCHMVQRIGTERHQYLIDAANRHELLGCLAITEVSHGSNTKNIQTRATYDPSSEEFVLNSDDIEAAKCWVGNLSRTCTWAILFAQLYSKGHCYGMHAFVVPIRQPDTMDLFPGIIAGDMGEKIGLKGIDNGFVMFRNYRIPRENLLNKITDIKKNGDFECYFSDPNRIQSATFEILSLGRIAILQESWNILNKAVCIAIRYAAVRKQFTDGSSDREIPILEYQLHQYRLFPYVCAAAVFRVFTNNFINEFCHIMERSASGHTNGKLSEFLVRIHVGISCAKPLITWTTRDAVQECREACGGHGFLWEARFGELHATNDPMCTYEGDNNVLGQQASNWLLRQWINYSNGNGEAVAQDATAIDNEVARTLVSCNFFADYKRILNSRATDIPEATFSSYASLMVCFEWLILYIASETHQRYIHKQQNRPDSSALSARNNVQVFWAAVLTRAYGQYVALKYYFQHLDSERPRKELHSVLEKMGLLYGFWCLEKYLGYFYDGGFAQCQSNPNSVSFAEAIRQTTLKLCDQLKPNIVAVIDSLSPPDYVLNSVLGKSNGLLYQNLQHHLLKYLDANIVCDWSKPHTLRNKL